MIALFAGSFHPPTVGHLDIIKRSARMFDMVYVAVMYNGEKTYAIDLNTRIRLLKAITAELPNVSVVSATGLTVDLAKSLNAEVLIRGVRNAQDFEYENQIADANRHMANIDTVYLPCLPEHSWISSTIVNDVIRNGGSVEGMVPEEILNDIVSAVRRASKGV